MENAEIAVLVVEDEPMILMTAVDFLEDSGFRVYGARNADEAIERLEEHDDIQVLFTDVDMPGSMNGVALAHAARERWASLQVVVTSGFARIRTTDLPRGGVFVPKPYSHGEVTDLVRKVASPS